MLLPEDRSCARAQVSWGGSRALLLFCRHVLQHEEVEIHNAVVSGGSKYEHAEDDPISTSWHPDTIRNGRTAGRIRGHTFAGVPRCMAARFDQALRTLNSFCNASSMRCKGIARTTTPQSSSDQNCVLIARQPDAGRHRHPSSGRELTPWLFDSHNPSPTA